MKHPRLTANGTAIVRRLVGRGSPARRSRGGSSGSHSNTAAPSAAPLARLGATSRHRPLRMRLTYAPYASASSASPRARARRDFDAAARWASSSAFAVVASRDDDARRARAKSSYGIVGATALARDAGVAMSPARVAAATNAASREDEAAPIARAYSYMPIHSTTATF